MPRIAMATADDREQELARHRAAIDAIDREILAKLNARAVHAQEIGRLKTGGLPAGWPEHVPGAFPPRPGLA